MDRADFLYKDFIKCFGREATPCQDALFRDVASFITCDDSDILVVNGYAGTGKTTVARIIAQKTKENRFLSAMDGNKTLDKAYDILLNM